MFYPTVFNIIFQTKTKFNLKEEQLQMSPLQDLLIGCSTSHCKFKSIKKFLIKSLIYYILVDKYIPVLQHNVMQLQS